MDFLKKLFEQIIFENAEDWDLSKCIPVVGSKKTKSPPGGTGGVGGKEKNKQRVRVLGPIEADSQGEGEGGESSSSSKIEPGRGPGGKPGKPGKPGKNPFEGEGETEGEGKEGEKKQQETPTGGKPGKPTDKKPAGGEVGKTITVNLPKNDKKTKSNEPVGTKAGKILDDHNLLKKSDTSSRDLVQKVYNETKTYYGVGKGKGEGTGEGGDLISIVEKALTPPFNVAEIKKRLSFFKESIKKRAIKLTYANPVYSQTGPFLRKAPLDDPNVIQPTAILIFAADVSGSISSEDYSFIFSFLDDIAKQFKSGSRGVKGKVYLIEWDDAVHMPIRRWETINENNICSDAPKQRRLKHGGGTVISNLFEKLEQLFYREDKGKPYFVFDETGKEFGDINYEKNKTPNPTKIKIPLSAKNIVKSEEPKELKSFEQGRLVFQEGQQGTSNVPFLVIYTDGQISKPDLSKNKLYANNPGNIIYIVTQKDGISNLNPRNFVYHNLHGE